MSDNNLICHADRRRNIVRRMNWNGLDYIEVDLEARTLTVYFINESPDPLHPPRVWLEGGSRIPAAEIRILAVEICPPGDPDLDRCMQIRLDRCGDLSRYRLCVASDEWNRFDARYACIEFSFADALPSRLDCLTEPICPPDRLPAPEINYLAKDYASFRQALLDRMAQTLPEWKERHVPDLGITLVELLAYTADHLSYYQDAVGAEAYLDTARRRISVRRHARLVDYYLHEGCSARAWIAVQPAVDHLKLDPLDVFFITALGDLLPAATTVMDEWSLRDLASESFQVFEPAAAGEINLYRIHNELYFYAWGDRECCLPKGATRAKLRYPWQTSESPPDPGQKPPEYEKAPTALTGPKAIASTPPQAQMKLLQVGDVLILAEVKGPRTGSPTDADPTRRHAVRLTEVNYVRDELHDPPIPLVEIAWSLEDALPFPLCISAISAAPECRLIEDISVAWGNIIACDHGRRMREKEPFIPPAAETADAGCLDEGQPTQPICLTSHFNPYLSRKPLTHAVPWLPTGPAVSAHRLDPRRAVPQVQLLPENGLPASNWLPQTDLLSSRSGDRHFVVETDDDRRAWLRFSTDGESGTLPDPLVPLWAEYRIGCGNAGNVGAESLIHLVYRQNLVADVERVFNPLPAYGGEDPEPLSEARLLAPTAFRYELMRAITPADYASLAMRDERVQRAAANLRWTGAWWEVQVAIDAYGHTGLDEALRSELEAALEPYRRIGHDLRVVPAEIVPLDLRLQVCLKQHALRGHVRAALEAAFSSRVLPGGGSGYFHPDRLSFGQDIHISALTATAQSISGVESVQVTRLWRLWEPFSEVEGQAILNAGMLLLHPLEIACLENDPNRPDLGLLSLDLKGGR